MAEPTKAGRALRDEYPGIYYWEDGRWDYKPLGEAIEQEARAALLAELRERVATEIERNERESKSRNLPPFGGINLRGQRAALRWARDVLLASQDAPASVTDDL